MPAQVYRSRPGPHHLGHAALRLPDGDPADGGPGAGPAHAVATQAGQRNPSLRVHQALNKFFQLVNLLLFTAHKEE